MALRLNGASNPRLPNRHTTPKMPRRPPWLVVYQIIPCFAPIVGSDLRPCLETHRMRVNRLPSSAGEYSRRSIERRLPASQRPYVQLLSWFDQHHGKERLQNLGSLNVHIVTDSQVVANWGTAAMTPGSPVPRKYGAYWSAMRYFRSLGYVCTFHWAPRMTTNLNWASDLIAGLARVAMVQLPSESASSDMTIAQRAAETIGQLDFHSPSGVPLDVYSLD